MQNKVLARWDQLLKGASASVAGHGRQANGGKRPFCRFQNAEFPGLMARWDRRGLRGNKKD